MSCAGTGAGVAPAVKARPVGAVCASCDGPGCVCGTCGCFFVLSAGAAGAGAGTAATAPNAAGLSWCFVHASKFVGVTVNTLKCMFACDVPQYSAQKPFHAPSPTES